MPVAGADPESCACGFAPGCPAEAVFPRNVSWGVRGLKILVWSVLPGLSTQGLWGDGVLTIARASWGF